IRQTAALNIAASPRMARSSARLIQPNGPQEKLMVYPLEDRRFSRGIQPRVSPPNRGPIILKSAYAMSGAPLRLLIVEDEAPLRAVYHSLLKDPSLEGRFDVLMAENSRAANKALKKKLPDIVVLDWNLPDGSGLEILDVIRCSPGGRQVQVFVVTGLSGNDRQVEALRSGADDYLAKPFDPSVL